MPFGVANYQGFRSPQPTRVAQPRPDNRAGPFGANPAFPSLASGPQRAPASPPIRTPAPGRAPAPTPQGGQQPQAPPMQPSPINPQPTPTPVAPTVSYDYNADPIIQQIKGFSQSGRENAKSDAAAAKNKAVIDFGDPTLATTLGLDPGTIAAAGGNQFGVLPTLKRNYDLGAQNLDEQLNDNGNLFYGGYRTLQQGNLSRDYQGQLAGATGQEGDILGQIGSGLRDALLGYDQSDAQALLNNPPAAVGAPAAAPDVASLLTPDQQPAPTDIASQIFPTDQTPLLDTGAQQPVPIDYSLASQLFPTDQTPLVDPAALAPPPPPPADPLLAALSQYNPRKKLGPADLYS